MALANAPQATTSKVSKVALRFSDGGHAAHEDETQRRYVMF
jgi:predicted ABC-type ATPase